MTYPHEEAPETAAEALEEALQVHDVFDGMPRERIGLATKLAAHGFIPEDIQLLAESIRRSEKRNAPVGGLLRTILDDPSSASERVQDIRRGVARRKRADKAEPGRADRKVGDLSSGVFSTLDENTKRRMAVAIVCGDRKSEQFAADVIGVSVDQVRKWIAQERQSRSDDLPDRLRERKEKADAKTHEQRLEEFRQMMRNRKGDQ